jgi:dTDP-4-dehydrorhamnose 3,5-epimerase-like enzyme
MSYKEFEIQKSKVLPDVLIIKPSMHWDLRGSIYSSFNADYYPEFLPKKLDFKHDKFAQSKNNVLRGLHGDQNMEVSIMRVGGTIRSCC